MVSSFPTVLVSFDDGGEYTIETRARDMAIAERTFGHDFQQGGMVTLYATALGALHRLHRAGKYDGVLPDSLDAMLDLCDVTVVADDSGKVSDPAPTTGSSRPSQSRRASRTSS